MKYFKTITVLLKIVVALMENPEVNAIVKKSKSIPALLGSLIQLRINKRAEVPTEEQTTTA